MAILIVDDENSTREALRSILVMLNYQPILEARNGEEALRIAESERSRIRLIIADLEMPYMDGITLLNHISQKPELDMAPFLLITSDLSKARLAELRTQFPRLDGHLLKPFRKNALESAIGNAFKHRASWRNTLLFLTQNQDEFEHLPASVFAQWPKRIFINPTSDVVTDQAGHHEARTGVFKDDLGLRLGDSFRSLGAIFLKPNFPCLPKTVSWLADLKKTPQGALIPVVCLSRNPTEILSWRSVCQFFAVFPSSTEDWQDLLNKITNRIQSTWEVEGIFRDIKAKIQEKNHRGALASVNKIIAMDPFHVEALLLAGDQLDALDSFEQAMLHYYKSLEINPCLPGPYIKLMLLFLRFPALFKGANMTIEKSESVVEAATVYCPENSDILFLAASLWKEKGDSAKAKELLQRVLTMQPRHEAAQKLRDSLGS